MYSDNHFEDLAFEPGSTNTGYSSTFDINDYGLSAELFSDPSYQISSTSNNPLLQTIQRNTTSSSSRQDYASSHLANGGGNNENDNSASSMSGIGNALLGSPQPSTIKKLKSHLSGIGGMGGYLTSPMGSFRQNNNNNNNSNTSPAYSVLKPKASSSGSNLNNHHSLGSSPLKPIHSSQQQQDPQCLELHTPLPPMPQPMHGTHQYMNDSNSNLSSTSMQRLQSAPASVPHASTSTSTGRSLKSKKSNINEQPHSATGATFNEMDYGGMRIYGRPIPRSASEDPSNTNNNNSNRSNSDQSGNNREGVNAAFLPYPDQLPTVTLGRGVKNARDVTNSSSSSYPMSKSESEPIPTPSTSSANTRKAFTNLNKPFIQYVAPNSPAGKSAAARNKKSLTVKTVDGQDSYTVDNGNNNRGKMIPIKMARQPHEMPLTPPISATMASPQSQSNNVISPHQQQSSQMQSFQNLSNMQHQIQFGGQALSPYRHEQQQQDDNNRPYFSPVKNSFDFNTDNNQGGLSNLPPPHMPSFEFSLEQFGGQALSDNNQDILDQFNLNNGYNNGNAIDFSSVLGLPSPHQLQHQDSHSSNNGSSNHSNHGLLSPSQPPHSAASTHSSVFSDDQALLFGIPPPASPYFSPSIQDDENQQQSIDQALANLLGTQVIPNRDGSTTPQPRLNIQNNYSPSHQQQQMFSPNLHQQNQHQGQIALGISSPPLSPQHNAMTSPAPSTSWAPYQQQSNMQNLLPNIDPSLQGLDNHQNQQDLGMLSPQSAHYGGNNHYSSHQQQVQHNPHHMQANNGRTMSSPRRLRGMQSAPDLNAMYSDASNGFNEAFGITSPSPRKPSLKRGRGNQYGDEDSDEENQHVQQNPYGYTQYGEGSSEQDDEDDEYRPNDDYDRPPPRKRANSIHSGGKIDPTFANNNNNAVAAVLLPLVNPNPARLRPGPKPKTSLPNLQAAHQGVFQVSPRAPPVPAFPTQYLSAASPNPSNAESSGTTPGAGGGCLSPDPDTGYLKPQITGVSKDMLATFYQIGTGAKQTKKGKPQRMYICSIPGCEKEFPRKSAVESHIQTHLEDKPFACPYDSCGASFVRSHDLTRHVRIHSGSKPFQCICGKGFARGDALTRHRQRGICEGSLVPRRW